jgi:hypothetical protein
VACLASLNISSPAPTRRLEVWRGARINDHSNRSGGCSMAFPPRAFEVLETFQVPNRRGKNWPSKITLPINPSCCRFDPRFWNF